MKLVIERSVTVITPTIGSPKLADAIKSVQEQTYGHIEHLIVVDGEQYNYPVNKLILEETGITRNMTVMFLPHNTGANGFYGHRIYAGIPHFLNSDYIFFLDEDNWYEPDHVETLVNVLDKGNDFAFSFRKIYEPDKTFVCDDNCEALGKWPIFFSIDSHNPHYLIDTSAFAFQRKFLNQTAHVWHHGWGGDRNYFNTVKKLGQFGTNHKHTLCYRLDGNPGSVGKDFFIQGNATQLEYYNGVLPWLS
jgi:glycosyltransferase involved in cell wall biosynthesis